MYIKVENISKYNDDNHNKNIILDNINFQVNKGEFVCLFGPSGSGKSTLLNILAGFEKPSEGSVTFSDKELSQSTIKQISIFENYPLPSWLTVEENIKLALEGKVKINQDIINKFLQILNLSTYAQSVTATLPEEIKQKVILTQNLTLNPDIILMDEPFKRLDLLAKIKLQEDFKKLCQKCQLTVIFITSDIDEAIFLADRIVLMTPNPGKIKKIIPVSIGQRKVHNSYDFLKIRDHIIWEFKEEAEDSIEYYI